MDLPYFKSLVKWTMVMDGVSMSQGSCGLVVCDQADRQFDSLVLVLQG